MGIKVEGVSMAFGKTVALDNVTVQFGGPHIYGLLGNNGAGKTTLLHTITDRVRPDSGTVCVDTIPVRNRDAALHRVFLAGAQNLFPEDMKIRQALRAAQEFYPEFDRAYADALAEKFGLDEQKKITALSTGYASIFRLVVGLAMKTPYLMFDEPVLGLDAQHRDLFYRELVAKFSDSPATIVVSTHLIAEVEDIVDSVVILKNGRVLRDCPAEKLAADACCVSGPAALVEAYLAGHKALSVKKLGGLETVALQGAAEDLPEGLEASRLGLQDYFISLMEGNE
jgi:ABC-2 type transport system ATP-binding protein